MIKANYWSSIQGRWIYKNYRSFSTYLKEKRELAKRKISLKMIKSYRRKNDS